MVALVLGVHNLIIVVEHGELDGGGAHVDAQMQVAAGGLGVEDCAFGGLGGGGDHGLVNAGRGSIGGECLSRRILGLGNCLGDLLGSGSRGLLRNVHHGRRGLARGSDHAVLDAFDEFAHQFLLLVVGLDSCGGVDRVLELQIQ